MGLGDFRAYLPRIYCRFLDHDPAQSLTGYRAWARTLSEAGGMLCHRVPLGAPKPVSVTLALS